MRKNRGRLRREPVAADTVVRVGERGLGSDDPALPEPMAELAAFLASDRVRPGAMSLSGLDGLLAALAAGPEPVGPEEWMPLVWGGSDPDFRDIDEAWRIVDAIMTRWSTIVRQLREEPDAYRPIFRTLDDGAEIAADWARGFWTGLMLRPAAWDPLERTPERWRAAVFIFMHIPDWDGRVLAGRESPVLAAVRREARATLPSAVVDIFRFWQARRRGRRDG